MDAAYLQLKKQTIMGMHAQLFVAAAAALCKELVHTCIAYIVVTCWHARLA